MEPQAHMAHLRSDGPALAFAARQAPEAPIPSCPEWDMTGLLAHVGGVHEWVNQILSSRSTTYLKRQTIAPEGSRATIDWYEEELGELMATLEASDPAEEVWNWRDRGPAPAAFWFRRMAQETAVHRWDAQAAAAVGSGSGAGSGSGYPQPLAPALAVDGIDEYLSFVGLWLAHQPVEGLEGSLHLHATDMEGEWSLFLRPDGLEHRREHIKSDVAIRGPVSDLMLWMLNRIPAESPSLTVFGEPDLLERWRQLQF